MKGLPFETIIYSHIVHDVDDLHLSSSWHIAHWPVHFSIGFCPGQAFLACSRCGPTSSFQTPFQTHCPGVPVEHFHVTSSNSSIQNKRTTKGFILVRHISRGTKFISVYNFPAQLLVFSVTPFKIDQNKKSKPFNRLSLESGNRKKVDMQRPSPKFRSQQFFLWKICGETFSPNL